MTVEELIKEIIPFFMVPVIIMVLSTLFRIIKSIMQGTDLLIDTIEKSEEKSNEIIKEEEKKINIDKDLEKYFNYKE